MPRLPLKDIIDLANIILEQIRQLPSVTRADLVGSVRRNKDTVKDIDIICSATPNVFKQIKQLDTIKRIISKSEDSAVIETIAGVCIDFRIIDPESYGAALVFFSGSKEHNILIRERGEERGLEINEYGVWKNQQWVAGTTEESVYAAIDSKFIPPEERLGPLPVADGRLP